MPLSFHGKKIGQNETLSDYMEKPNLDYFLPKMDSFLLHMYILLIDDVIGQIDTLFNYMIC